MKGRYVAIKTLKMAHARETVVLRLYEPYVRYVCFANPAWAVGRFPFFYCFLKSRESIYLSNYGWNQFPNFRS